MSIDNAQISIPAANTLLIPNATIHVNASYYGLNYTNFLSNLYSNYSLDYSTSTLTDFSSVFGVLFSGVTGIMAGANMSGNCPTVLIS